MIRPYIQSDGDEVVHIWLEASIKAHYFIGREYWESKAEEMKTTYLPQSESYVYIDEGANRIVGFISLIDTYLAAIFVMPHQQGRGIGKALINYAKSIRQELTLGVYSKNKPSVMFYKSQGFITENEQTEENTGEKEYKMKWSEKL